MEMKPETKPLVRRRSDSDRKGQRQNILAETEKPEKAGDRGRTKTRQRMYSGREASGRQRQKRQDKDSQKIRTDNSAHK